MLSEIGIAVPTARPYTAVILSIAATGARRQQPDHAGRVCSHARADEIYPERLRGLGPRLMRRSRG